MTAAPGSAIAPAADPTTSWARVIDVHHHALPPVYLEAMRDVGEHVSIPGVAFPKWSLAASLDTMDAAGIDVALLSITAPGLGAARGAQARRIAQDVNDALAGYRRANERFGALALLPLPDVDVAIREAGRAVDELGLDGVGLYTSVDGSYLGDERFDPLLDYLDARDITVFVHPTAPAHTVPGFGLPASLIEFPFETTRAVVNLLFRRTLERFPNLRIVVTHAGGTIPFLAQRLTYASTIDPSLAQRQPPDIPASLRRLYFDLTTSATDAQLSALRAVVPVDHILFGSDFPFMPDWHARRNLAGFTSSAHFGSDDERTLVSRVTPLRLFPRLCEPRSERA